MVLRRLMGIGVAGSIAAFREWILGTTAAATGGRRSALLQTAVAAAPHSGSHVGAAIVNRGRGRGRGRREKSQRAKYRGRRHAGFQNLFLLHLILSLCVSAFTRIAQSTWCVAYRGTIGIKKVEEL